MNSTHDNCKLVVFSNKAWNAIVNETFRKDPVETGGILLGHILSNGYWIVMEAIPPGLSAIHQKAYFEYDTDFVNYLANSVAKQYKMDLSVLGLWHRHPGSMDVFSGTDDGTNATFAQMNEYGAISGLVNIDPKLRFTLRHVAYPLHYQIVDIEVGDDLIPPQYFELKYSYGNEAIPFVQEGNNEPSKTHISEPERDYGAVTLPAAPEKKENEEKVHNRRDIPPVNGIPKFDIRDSARHWAPIVVASLLFLALGLWIGGKSNGKKDKEKTEQAPAKEIRTEKTHKSKDNGTDKNKKETIGLFSDRN